MNLSALGPRPISRYALIILALWVAISTLDFLGPSNLNVHHHYRVKIVSPSSLTLALVSPSVRKYVEAIVS